MTRSGCSPIWLDRGRAALAILVCSGIGAAGCGEVREKGPLVDAWSDAVLSDAALSDAAASSRCDPRKPFGPEVPVDELNTSANEDGAWLTPDERTLYFSTTRDGSFDIYSATRDRPEAKWDHIAPVAGINTADMMERGPVVTPDGLTLYATRQIGSDYNVLVARRSAPDGRFGAFESEPSLNATSTDVDDSPSAILADRTMLFESNWSGYADLYQASWDGTKYSEITMLGGLEYTDATSHMRSVDSGPKLTADRLTLYFTSNRDGANVEDYNIWVATRTQPSGPFSNPTKLALNTDALESTSWISADDCVLYFLRRVAPSNYDLFTATKPP